MKRFIQFAAPLFLVLVMMSSCTEEIIVDPTLPSGAFTVARSGSFVAQSGTQTTGVAELGTDEDGTQFLRFGNTFTTKFSTGTVAVYFSTSDTYKADPGSDNPDLILAGITRAGGEQYIRTPETIGSNFTHVILWCASAGIPFGNAELK
ncbi:MAG: DM13 domain-containing protein [Bacteroidia bacterium]|nr:DM13 domain-containing protein [Bacteroidia bacterium]